MMSDECWNQLARESAIQHLTKANIEIQEESIEAYDSFLRIDESRCSGVLFNERLRKVVQS